MKTLLLKSSLNLFVLFLIGLSTSSTLFAQSVSEIQKLVASDRGFTDLLGVSASISGNYAVVSAIGQDTDATGGNSLLLAGAAYIYEKDGTGTWAEVQKIVASDRGVLDAFGTNVSISGDYAIVGATGQGTDATGGDTLTSAGAAYIFERDVTGTWTEVQKIVASDRAANNSFGISVSISGDYAIVGATGQRTDATGGDTLEIAGAAYVYKRDVTGTWVEVQKIVASDRAALDFFGFSVAISGSHAIITAYRKDAVMGANNLPDAGAAYIFEENGTGTWVEVQKVVASDRAAGDEFGFNVAISGEHAIVGAYWQDANVAGGNSLSDAGAAYIYEKDGTGAWVEVQKIVASDRTAEDEFGFSVAISGDYAIVGAEEQATDTAGMNSLTGAGAAYLYKKDGTGAWVEVKKIVNSDRAANNLFGSSVCISGTDIIVSAVGQATDASGGGFAPFAGAAYIFDLTFAVSTQTVASAPNLVAYPNPAQNMLFIKQSSGRAIISNLLGQVLIDERLLESVPLDVSGLENGQYILTIYDEIGNGRSLPFIKAK